MSEEKRVIEKRIKHVEMIVDYVVVGEDFQYSDNHGILTR